MFVLPGNKHYLVSLCISTSTQQPPGSGKPSSKTIHEGMTSSSENDQEGTSRPGDGLLPDILSGVGLYTNTYSDVMPPPLSRSPPPFSTRQVKSRLSADIFYGSAHAHAQPNDRTPLLGGGRRSAGHLNV
jgi:hypothetical protein